MNKFITIHEEMKFILNQATFSKLRTLSAITDKLQNRYFDFWHKLLFNDNRVLKQTSKENNIFMQRLSGYPCMSELMILY
jgi:hypothetical protein